MVQLEEQQHGEADKEGHAERVGSEQWHHDLRHCCGFAGRAKQLGTCSVRGWWRRCSAGTGCRARDPAERHADQAGLLTNDQPARPMSPGRRVCWGDADVSGLRTQALASTSKKLLACIREPTGPANPTKRETRGGVFSGLARAALGAWRLLWATYIHN